MRWFISGAKESVRMSGQAFKEPLIGIIGGAIRLSRTLWLLEMALLILLLRAHPDIGKDLRPNQAPVMPATEVSDDEFELVSARHNFDMKALGCETAVRR